MFLIIDLIFDFLFSNKQTKKIKQQSIFSRFISRTRKRQTIFFPEKKREPNRNLFELLCLMINVDTLWINWIQIVFFAFVWQFVLVSRNKIYFFQKFVRKLKESNLGKVFFFCQYSSIMEWVKKENFLVKLKCLLLDSNWMGLQCACALASVKGNNRVTLHFWWFLAGGVFSHRYTPKIRGIK